MAQRIKRRKGCGLCSPYKIRGAGRAYKLTMSDLRKLGSYRRIGRHFDRYEDRA